MKKLPLGIQSIDKILANGEYIYVDKTTYIKQLIDGDSPHYFLSRPRRFGKSLFISTLEHIFKGNKDLFKGYAIYNTNYEWKEHPVLHFDFALIESETSDTLRKGLHDTLEDIAQDYGLTISGSSLKSQLTRLVRALNKKGGRVVVLVDEYDQPIINNLKDLETAYANRDILKNFFGALKGLDAHIRFTFVTGVSKFSQVSLFSGLNNLTDITMDENYTSMFGYTDAEIKKYFSSHIEAIAQKENQTSEVLEEMREWYNGYRFSRALSSVYNPFSTLNYLKNGIAENYWYSTGTPSFLIQQVQKQPQAVIPLSGITALKSTLSDISNLDRINLTALMFQTGYLTITDYDTEQDFYYLDFPNKEVRGAFFSSLIEDFAQIDPTGVIKNAQQVQNSLAAYDIKEFVAIMNAHFGKIAYPLFSKSYEGFYHAIFLTFLERSGIKIAAEAMTNIGRIDLTAEMSNTIYIFELKLNKTADVAVSQVEAKKYRKRYSHSAKEVVVVGINFSSETRNISDWKAKRFSADGKEIREL